MNLELPNIDLEEFDPKSFKAMNLGEIRLESGHYYKEAFENSLLHLSMIDLMRINTDHDDKVGSRLEEKKSLIIDLIEYLEERSENQGKLLFIFCVRWFVVIKEAEKRYQVNEVIASSKPGFVDLAETIPKLATAMNGFLKDYDMALSS